MDTQLLINKLIIAISYKYFEDKTSPNLTISALKKGYYCSIVRYGGFYGTTKEVVCKATADTLEEAVQDVSNQFVNRFLYPKDPLQELAEFLNNNDS
jgi:hypothetical protein